MKKTRLSHFQRRAANAVWETYNVLEKDARILVDLYEQAAKEVTEELYQIAEKLERNGTISRPEFHRGKHLQHLLVAYNDTLNELGALTEELGRESMLRGAEALYGNFSRLTGLPISYDRIGLQRLAQAPWLGATFSARVWNNQAKLFQELKTTVTSGIRTGKTTTQIAVALNNKMNAGLNNAFRLVRTETMHHLNEVNKRVMKDSGIVHQVKEVVTMDERTADECAEHHGLIHDIDKAPTLPRRPNCRCVLVPEIDVDALSKVLDAEEASLQP